MTNDNDKITHLYSMWRVNQSDLSLRGSISSYAASYYSEPHLVNKVEDSINWVGRFYESAQKQREKSEAQQNTVSSILEIAANYHKEEVPAQQIIDGTRKHSSLIEFINTGISNIKEKLNPENWLLAGASFASVAILCFAIVTQTNLDSEVSSTQRSLAQVDTSTIGSEIQSSGLINIGQTQMGFSSSTVESNADFSFGRMLVQLKQPNYNSKSHDMFLNYAANNTQYASHIKIINQLDVQFNSGTDVAEVEKEFESLIAKSISSNDMMFIGYWVELLNIAVSTESHEIFDLYGLHHQELVSSLETHLTSSQLTEIKQLFSSTVSENNLNPPSYENLLLIVRKLSVWLG